MLLNLIDVENEYLNAKTLYCLNMGSPLSISYKGSNKVRSITWSAEVSLGPRSVLCWTDVEAM